jgi:hypothetical protein
MFDGPPGLYYGLAIVLSASLVVAGRPGASASRRALACVLATLVPVVGLLLAELVRRTRGGVIPPEPQPERPSVRLSPLDVSRLGEMPPVLDRLLAGDPGERLEALVALSSTADAASVRVLRWALEHGPSDVVLDAALTLEEIELRQEARLAAMREAMDHTPDAALAAAQAAAASVLNGIADAAVAPALAEEARAYFQIALEGAPERAFEIDEQRARLELAAGKPREALAILDRLIARDRIDPTGHAAPADRMRIAQLRDDAAFAARDFTALTYVPSPLEIPADITARKLQTVLS